jgi:hypothetical protein
MRMSEWRPKQILELLGLGLCDQLWHIPELLAEYAKFCAVKVETESTRRVVNKAFKIALLTLKRHVLPIAVEIWTLIYPISAYNRHWMTKPLGFTSDTWHIIMYLSLTTFHIFAFVNAYLGMPLYLEAYVNAIGRSTAKVKCL